MHNCVLERRLPDVRKTSPLLKFASNKYSSQCGEDGILEELFGRVLENNQNGFLVDIGAWYCRYECFHVLIC